MGRYRSRSQKGVSADQVYSAVGSILDAEDRRGPKRRSACLRKQVSMMEKILKQSAQHRRETMRQLLANAAGLLQTEDAEELSTIQQYVEAQIGNGSKPSHRFQSAINHVREQLEKEIAQLKTTKKKTTSTKRSRRLKQAEQYDPEADQMNEDVRRKNNQWMRQLRHIRDHDTDFRALSEILVDIYYTDAKDRCVDVISLAYLALARIVERNPELRDAFWGEGMQSPELRTMISACFELFEAHKHELRARHATEIFSAMSRIGFIDALQQSLGIIGNILLCREEDALSMENITEIIKICSTSDLNLEPYADEIDQLIERFYRLCREGDDAPPTDELRRLCRGLLLMGHHRAKDVLHDYQAMRGSADESIVPTVFGSAFEDRIADIVQECLGGDYVLLRNVNILEVFEVDMIAVHRATGCRYIIEADGKDFHDEQLDAKRDRAIRKFAEGEEAIDGIIRIRQVEIENEVPQEGGWEKRADLMQFIQIKLQEGGLQTAAA